MLTTWHDIRVVIIAPTMAKHAIEVAEKTSKEATARQFDVDP